MENNELYHSGVKGMKWGVRRYRNKDGSLTNAGKRKLATSIKNQHPKDATDATRSQLAKDVADDLVKNYNQSQLQQQINAIRQKRAFADKVKEIDNAYYKSKDYKNDEESAYKDTYQYFEKNEPEYLRNITRKNNGDKRTLYQYDDFYTVYDGFLSDAIRKGLNRSYRKNGIDPKLANNAIVDYLLTRSDAAKSVVGKYGEMKLPKQGSYQPDRRVRDIVDDAITKLSEDEQLFI